MTMRTKLALFTIGLNLLLVPTLTRAQSYYDLLSALKNSKLKAECWVDMLKGEAKLNWGGLRVGRTVGGPAEVCPTTIVVYLNKASLAESPPTFGTFEGTLQFLTLYQTSQSGVECWYATISPANFRIFDDKPGWDGKRSSKIRSVPAGGFGCRLYKPNIRGGVDALVAE
ncbi:MAG: hypothetical protein V1798_06365 [Pseudomonadota bacterium]